MTRIAFGSWPSPITAASLTTGQRTTTFPVVDGGRIFWAEGRPDEGGRVVVMMAAPGQEPVEVTPLQANARTRVHEYGGRPYGVRDSTLVYSDFSSQRLMRRDLDSEAPAVPFTPDLDGPRLRWAAPTIDPSGSYVLAVQEDHRGGGECVNMLVRLELHGDNPDGGTPLVQGSDFVSAPRPNADWTRLAWVTWDHPNMPWDHTTLWVGELDEDGNLSNPRTLATDGSWKDPEWLADGRLSAIGEPGDWANLFAFDVTATTPRPIPLAPRESEFGGPDWVLDTHWHVVLPTGEMACAVNESGNMHLEILDPATGRFRSLGDGIVGVFGMAVTDELLVVDARFSNRPEGLIGLDPRTGRETVIRASSDEGSLPSAVIATARAVEWAGADGDTAYGHFFAPHNGDLHGGEGDLPPLLVLCHGGPTSMSAGAYSPHIFYWTSRGFAVLEVNYGGSTGYGRAYRERLRGRWGLVDVADAASGAAAMAERGLADGRRLAIRGGSAGGYLTLAALTFTNVFAAGASYFGVADLETLARDTHKFESRYTDSLVGPYPQDAQTYRDRSPVHHLDSLNAPMILLQGLNDEVVPPNQAQAMQAAVAAKGLPVAMVTFAGEGHGFRKAENTIRAIQSEEYFYGRVFGYQPAQRLPVVEIVNLP